MPIIDTHLTQQQAGIGLPQIRRAVMQLVAQEQGQLLDLRRRDHGFSHGETAGQIRNLIGKFVPAEPQIDQPLTHGRIVGIHKPLLDQSQQPDDARFGLLMFQAHLTEPIAIAALAFERGVQIVAEQADQMFGLQYLFRHLTDHYAVELVHWHAQSLAAQRAFLEAA
ncbi:hypothetical protein [Sphingobium yanoikuyae]|uniref:hypothetical protein n=1 Tax=Sphingobium yanoikuyae TaxID=13690 RepID=UPI0028AAAF5A|nr:hypothetical protein [Sphingobium yanoikuyae]